MGVLFLILLLWYKSRDAAITTTTKRLIFPLMCTGLVQIVLGIATLLLAVPVSLGVLHQVVAVVLFALGVHQLSPKHTQLAPVKVNTASKADATELNGTQLQNL